MPYVMAAGLAAFTVYTVYKAIKGEVRQRGHRVVSDGAHESKRSIKVMSYNTLADIFTDKEHGAHLNRNFLAFRRRVEILREEIRSSDSDVLCLQEIDMAHLKMIWEPFLSSLNYKFVHESRKGQDACLIAFKADKFEMISCVSF
jgi:CCR4-NOT transcription complex subunit 6